jgi:hypothetical protein
MNIEAVESGRFSAEAFEGIKLFAEDICVQASLLSYDEDHTAQMWHLNTYGVLPEQYLENLASLFSPYKDMSERRFAKSMAFALSRLNGLIERYERRSELQPSRYFSDTIGFGSGFKDVLRELRGDSTYFYLPYAGTGFRCRVDLDLQRGTTTIAVPDLYRPGSFGGCLTSAYLRDSDVFSERERENFLLPLAYREWVFPLINVVSIKTTSFDGDCVFAHGPKQLKR